MIFEQRGVAGVVEILQYLDVETDYESERGTLRWIDPELRQHAQFADPDDVYDLALRGPPRGSQASLGP